MNKHFRFSGSIFSKLEELGVRASAVLRRAGLPQGFIDEPRVLLKTEELFALWRAIGEVSSDPDDRPSTGHGNEDGTVPPGEPGGSFDRELWHGHESDGPLQAAHLSGRDLADKRRRGVEHPVPLASGRRGRASGADRMLLRMGALDWLATVQVHGFRRCGWSSCNLART